MSAKLKNAIKAVNKSALICGSLGALALSGAAFAQDDSGLVEEEVVVTGIRGALKNAVDIKRNASAVVDAVSAEDVGKFPDSDVGEALARIPGVAVSRQFGQGQQVSVRGSAPQLTSTLLNGHNVASTGWYDQQSIDRSFNYTMMPPQMVGGIEVYKSSRADLPEGGIGGTVIVNTRKPLDLDAHAVFASLKADYGTISENWDPEVSGLYSFKNDSETFAILGSLSVSKQEYLRTGTEPVFAWNGGLSKVGFEQERERTALNVAAQFAPNESLSFGINYMNLDLAADNANSALFALGVGDGADDNCVSANDSVTANGGGVCTRYEGSARFNRLYDQVYVREASMQSETVTLDMEFTGDGFTFDAMVGSTEASGGTDLTANFGWWLGSNADAANLVYDATGDRISLSGPRQSFTAIDFETQSLPETDPDFQGWLDVGRTGWSPEGWSVATGPNTDEETFLQTNLQFDVELGAINSIKTGVTYANHEVFQEQYRPNAIGAAAIPAWGTGGLTTAQAWELGETVDVGDGWSAPRPNASAMLDYTRDLIGDNWVSQQAGYGRLEEENKALYVMAEFEADGIRGDFGLRYIESDVTGEYYKFTPGTGYDSLDNISTQEHEYNDVLPSINVIFDLSDDILLRTTASQVISRPNYSTMFPVSALSADDNVLGNENLTTGSVKLNPFKASQADLSLEFYYGDGNMLSATYFVKEFSNFTTFDQQRNVDLGVASGDCGGATDCWTVVDYVDGTGGELDGFELQWNHAFDNGFGFATNYTYANGNAPAQNYVDGISVFSESSEHNVNAVGYWENDTFSARAAYNWRSEYMIREAGFYSSRMHDDYGSLDLSFGYSVTDNVDLSLEIVNMLEEDSVQSGPADGDNVNVKAEMRNNFPVWSYDGEARYKFGVSVNF